MRFDEKIALVTGGASGIGKATVMAFARAGATVICADVERRERRRAQEGDRRHQPQGRFCRHRHEQIQTRSGLRQPRC